MGWDISLQKSSAVCMKDRIKILYFYCIVINADCAAIVCVIDSILGFVHCPSF